MVRRKNENRHRHRRLAAANGGGASSSVAVESAYSGGEGEIAAVWLSGAQVQSRKVPVRTGGIALPPELANFRQCIRGRPVDILEADVAYPAHLSGSFAYGGVMIAHFGHMMCEGAHRIVPTLFAGVDAPFIVVGSAADAGKRLSELPAVPRVIYEFLGLTDATTVVVAENTVVERLFVSEQGSDGMPKPAYLEQLKAFTTARLEALGRPVGARTARVYVSRSGLGPIGRMVGERYLETVLERGGFTIFHPQQHPLVEQIATYAGAALLVFAEGSAVHGTELFGARQLGHVVILNRRTRAVPRRLGHMVAPRAERVDVFYDNPYLGTVMSHRATGLDLHNMGMSLVDVPLVLARLGDWGQEVRAAFDFAAFKAAADEEFEMHVGAPTGGHHAILPDAVAAMRERYAAALREIADRVGTRV